LLRDARRRLVAEVAAEERALEWLLERRERLDDPPLQIHLRHEVDRRRLRLGARGAELAAGASLAPAPVTPPEAADDAAQPPAAGGAGRRGAAPAAGSPPIRAGARSPPPSCAPRARPPRRCRAGAGPPAPGRNERGRRGRRSRGRSARDEVHSTCTSEE